MKIQAKYNFRDQYGNRKFSLTRRNNPNYDIIVKLARGIRMKYPNQFSPIYHNEEKDYITISTKSNFNFLEEHIYSAELCLYERQQNEKKYLNLSLNKVCLEKEPAFTKLSIADFTS